MLTCLRHYIIDLYCASLCLLEAGLVEGLADIPRICPCITSEIFFRRVSWKSANGEDASRASGLVHHVLH